MWLAYAVLAAAIWGLDYLLLERLFRGRVSPMFLLSIQMAVGALVTGAIGLLSGDFRLNLAALATNPAIWAVVLLSILTFVLGNYLIALSIREGSAIAAGFVEISYPLFIVLFSVLIFGIGQFNVMTVVGGGVVMLGVVILKLNH